MADHEMLTQATAAPMQAQIAREVARQRQAMKAAGIQLDRAARPGGYFLGADGTPHDAEGRPIAPLAPASVVADAPTPSPDAMTQGDEAQSGDAAAAVDASAKKGGAKR